VNDEFKTLQKFDAGKGREGFLHSLPVLEEQGIGKISRLPVPLPFGGLTAQRSVLSVQNFCSAVVMALTDSRARGETFIVSDPTPLSVSDVIARYRARSGRSAGLIAIPESWLELFLRAIGKSAIWHRIGCPLVARPRKLLALGWKPS